MLSIEKFDVVMFFLNLIMGEHMEWIGYLVNSFNEFCKKPYDLIPAVFLSKPSLVDVGVSAFVAVSVIVRCAAGRAFRIRMAMVSASAG